MGLAKDLSGLPQADRMKTEGVPPDESTWLLDPWIDAEVAEHEREGTRPQAFEDTRLRNSLAGNCARALSYYALGVPESNPFDIPGIIVTRNGTRQHDLIQPVLVEAHGMEIEVPVRHGGTTSGSADGFIWEDDAPNGEEVCWEHKNVGGYKYKKAIGIPPASSVPQGPNKSHIIQGAVNALAKDVQLLVITYATWEMVSRQQARRYKLSERQRVVSQWTFARDYWEPIARAELSRMERVLALVEDGELPARVIPDPELAPGHRVEDPSTGAWMAYDPHGVQVDGGTTWHCDYCSWQDFCAVMPSGRTPVADMVMIAGRHGLDHGAPK